MVMGGGFIIGLLVLIFLLLMLAAAIGIGIWVYRQTPRGTGTPAGRQSSGLNEDPLEVLKRRYASGEISREEYQSMREDINR